jgi:hypothetical protein
MVAIASFAMASSDVPSLGLLPVRGAARPIRMGAESLVAVAAVEDEERPGW